MITKTYTLLVSITAEHGHPVFDTTTLADAVTGALEVGTKGVIKGVPDVVVPGVASAVVTAGFGNYVSQKMASLHDHKV